MLKTLLVFMSLSSNLTSYSTSEQELIDRIKQIACEDARIQALSDYIHMRIEGEYPARTNLWLDRIEEDFYISFGYNPKVNDQKRFSDLYSRQTSLCYEQFLDLKAVDN